MAIDINALTESYPGFKVHWGMDEFVFSAQGNDLNHSRKADKVDGSGFGTRVKNNLPGMQEGNLKIKGLAAMSRGRVNAILNERFGRTSPVNVWYATQGLNMLSPVTSQPSSITDSSITAKLKDSVGFDAEFDARGDYNDGYILLSPKDLITGTTVTGLVDIADDSTSTGGVGHLYVLAVDGGTSASVAVEIQHSTDDGATFTELVTFEAATKPGAQRIALPSTTTVGAQVQATATITGTPDAVQLMATFARGIDLDA